MVGLEGGKTGQASLRSTKSGKQGRFVTSCRVVLFWLMEFLGGVPLPNDIVVLWCALWNLRTQRERERRKKKRWAKENEGREKERMVVGLGILLEADGFQS